MGGSILKHDGILGGIFPVFMWVPYRIKTGIIKGSKFNHISILKVSQEHLDSSQ